MQHFVDEARAALQSENYYAALALALTLPDIAGRVRSPTEGSGARYKAWWKDYVEPTYGTGPVKLTGDDAYALRCALLHEGSDDIEHQKAQKIVKGFKIIQPLKLPNVQIHMNQMNDKLNIQVDQFCEEILRGIEAFLADAAKDSQQAARLASMAQITFLRSGEPIQF